MNSFLQKHHRKLFYILWALLGIVQAASTQLIDDEAYYWVYSRFLSWGYFDHPPLTALLIKWGYTVFQNELGVRLLSVLLNVAAIMIMETLTERKNPFLFYAIALSIASLQVIGFLAVPDNALLFFTALFFYCYKKFLQYSTFSYALLLGLVTALLLYTKYHGLLVVFFTLISNTKLFGKWQTWLAGMFALLLYSPHLYWQWQNDWVSFRYHLFESNVDPYKISFTTDYLLSQLLLAGPLVSLLLIPAAFIYRPQNKTESALRFTMIGIYALFFISSFRGRVEANWPAPVLIPVVVLGHQYINSRKSFLKPLRITAMISLVLIMFARIYMLADIGPDNGLKRRFHSAKKWVKEINEKTGSYPVVFTNSYQRASQFWFYSGKPAHNIHHYMSRRSNYNLWPTDINLLGQPVYFATEERGENYTDSVYTGKRLLYTWYDSSFASLGKAVVNPGKDAYNVHMGELLNFTIRPQFPDSYRQFLTSHPQTESELIIGISEGKKEIKESKTGITAEQLIKNDSLNLIADTKDLPPGKYIIRLSIRVKNYILTHNSKKIKLVVE